MMIMWPFVLCVVLSFVLGTDGDLACQKLKTMMEAKKLHAPTLSKPLSGGRRACGREARTCCTQDVEDVLTAETRREFVQTARSDMGQLYSLLNTRARRFNDFFTTLLLGSKKDFDEMFKATYGIVYEENAYVFTDLFEELEKYYSKGQVDLEESMENFFSTLYQKMFTVINAQYQFDDKYLSCVGDHMKDLKPFGDVPQKLSVQIKRSFVATRTFAQALNIAKDVVSSMQNLGPAGDCSHAMARMSVCQFCRDAADAKPCSSLCLNVMKGCWAYHAELDQEWNHFLDALDRVIVRLLGPFNIENVVEPIDIKISEAIMNFQENAPDVSEKVFNGCGRPFLSRRGRDTREIELSSYTFSRDTQKAHPTMEKLLREIRQKAKESRGFWSNLPYRICNQEAFVSKDDKQCWNGTHVARYTRTVVGNGLNSQASNPEVSIDTSRPKSILNEQIYILKMLTSKLKNAHNGYDVDWIDIEEMGTSNPVGSGDGSGDDELPMEGSGRNPYDDNDPTDGDDPVDGSVPSMPSSPSTTTMPTIPTSHNNESNLIPVVPKVTPGIGHGPNWQTGQGSSANRPSLLRVVVSYVFPICVIWLGGIFTEWL